MTEVFVGIGSNIDSEQNTLRALAALRSHFGHVEESTVYESEAVGFEGENFLNLVVRLSTDKPVVEIATILRQIEEECGRDRGGIDGHDKLFADRTMDLDILLYGDSTGVIDGIELPRIEITVYAHVLLPLAELAGDRIDPESSRSYAELAQSLDTSHALWPTKLP